MTASLRPDHLAAAAVADGVERLGLALDARQQQRLLQYAELLLRWNRIHNLTAIDRPEQLLTHHLLDSLAVAPTITARAGGRNMRLLDVGSGGGLPGIPLAIALPELTVTLVDKVQKKAAFLAQAKLELALPNVEVVCARIEDVRVAAYDIIVSRALGALEQLVRWTAPLLAPRGCWIAMKGAVPADEIAALERARPGMYAMSTVKLHVPGLAAERHVVIIEPIEPQ